MASFPNSSTCRASRQGVRILPRSPNLILESGHSREQAADAFQEWFRNLNLPLNRRLLPLASNWAFEYSFLTAWLGHEGRDMIFDSRARDTM